MLILNIFKSSSYEYCNFEEQIKTGKNPDSGNVYEALLKLTDLRVKKYGLRNIKLTHMPRDLSLEKIAECIKIINSKK